MSITCRKNELFSEYFTVTNSNNELVTGIDSTSFITHIIDPDGNEVSSTIVNYIIELMNGHYKISFVPNKTKTWYIIVYHSTYFPWGKAATINVFDNDFDSISLDLIRALGLMQENYYLDQIIYDSNNCLISGRIRIYSTSGAVGTTSNVIATYNIEAIYNSTSNPPTLETYKVTKE